jgi:hypothetical protein
MIARYTLGLEDHLAWYDHYCTTPYGRYEKSRLPIIGKYFNRMARENYGRWVNAKDNQTAFGERTLELRADGAREFSDRFDFMTRWSEIELIAATDAHLFIAHFSMNAHVVPLQAFATDAERVAFIRCAESRGAGLKVGAQSGDAGHSGKSKD